VVCPFAHPYTDKAPSSVRDQIADHESNAVKYYLDEVVRFDVQAAVMELSSDEAIHALAHSLFANADMIAPTELTKEQKHRITSHLKIKKLTEKNIRLTDEIKKNGYSTVMAAYGTDLY
jgi:hypothetical protein